MKHMLPEHVRAWLTRPLDEDATKLLRMTAVAPGVTRVAVMPDAHPAEAVCNGCVLAVRDRVYPQAVGQDIGCGFATVRLAFEPIYDLPREQGQEILEGFARGVAVIRHGKRTMACSRDIEEIGALSQQSLQAAAMRDGRVQLGTLGRGNHFLELQRDDEGTMWLMVHSGSRAMGKIVYEHALRQGMRDGTTLTCLMAGTPACDAYLADAAWTLRYATANRRRLLTLAAVELERFGIGADWTSLIDSPHNMISLEEVDGVTQFVHRKGAARARDGEAGLIAGSAGTFSVHTMGRGSADGLQSCSHGAGRVLSRSEARARVGVKELKRSMQRVVFDEENARRLIEEAPCVYRDLREVMEAQRDLVRVLRRVTPMVSYKAV